MRYLALAIGIQISIIAIALLYVVAREAYAFWEAWRYKPIVFDPAVRRCSAAAKARQTDFIIRILGKQRLRPSEKVILDRLITCSITFRTQLRRSCVSSGLFDRLVSQLENRNSNAWQRALAAYKLGILGGRAAATALLRNLHDQDREVRYATLEALSLMPHKRVMKALTRLFQNPSWGELSRVAVAIRNFGGKADDMMRDLLNHPNPTTRRWAATSLNTEAPIAIPKVYKSLGHKFRLYVPVKIKFLISMAVASAWFLFSFYFAKLWIRDLAVVVGGVPSFLVILFIALIPGFLNILLLMSIILDSPPRLDLDILYPPVSILIAAYNEELSLPETIRGIRGQDYPGEIEIIVVDDGSQDKTVEILASFGLPNLRIVHADHGGKAHALNKGLERVSHDILIAIDADTFLHPQALKRIVARLLSDPAYTAAVAGCVLVKNSRASFMTRLQEWDYFAAITSVKRQQSLYQGTLVAQGAFSAFRTEIVRKYKGWPSVIGEDIVLTWAILKDGQRVGFEPTAIGFTLAPFQFKGFFRQRKRWARGMIEGLKRHGNMIWERPRLPAFFVGIDFIFPLLDSFYTFAFLPGVVLACTGRFYIVGPLTLLVFPLTFLIVLIMYNKQKGVFDAVGLKVRSNRLGALMYMLIYQVIMSPICVIGYSQEILGMAKRW